MASGTHKAPEADMCVCFHFCRRYLLLAEDQQALGLDGMVGSQILPAPPLDSILKSLPDPIAGGPGHADVVPLPVVNEERQLRHLEEGNHHKLESLSKTQRDGTTARVSEAPYR